MPVTSTTAANWSLVGRVATSLHGTRLDLDAPGRGLVLPRNRDSLLGVDLRTEAAVGEHWLRGDDLIAVYEPPDTRRLRATAMWRVHPTAAPPDAIWELTLSAQTSLVQSDALLAVTCDVGCLDLRCRSADGAWVAVAPEARLPDDAICLLLRRPTETAAPPTTILVAVHPADASRTVVRRHDGRAEVACWLFSAAIEKGVLMRGRVLAAVGPTAGDEAWADGAVKAFASAAPPLTA